MKIDIEISDKNYKEISKKFRVLGNPKYLQLLLIIGSKPQSLDEVQEKVNKIYFHRESTYKVLEKLVEAEFIKKEYDQKKKIFIYSWIQGK
jgi:predicted transcriptional regulator